MKIAIVGAGWAGMAAAVTAAQAGAQVSVFEATRTLGGRARALALVAPDGTILFKQIGPFTVESLRDKLLPAIEKAMAPAG